MAETMTLHPAYDGESARIYELKNKNGMKVSFMDIGATWLSCKLPVNNQGKEVLLGLSSMPDFEKHGTYLGATVGRFANRIANGCFTIDGETFQVWTNQGENVLHGGPEGFNKRRWAATELEDNSIMFALVSPDGDQGFPGELKATVTYTLTNDNEVVIRYTATSDKPTPVNLTNHAYFNLENAEEGVDCREHKIRINANYYLPTRADGIPFDEFAAVKNTSFDFTQFKAISTDFLADEQQKGAKGYDHSYIFNPLRNTKEPVATLTNRDESISLEVYTDKPAMQFYTGNWNDGTPRRIGGEYQDYSGIALETQLLPDAPNHPEWPGENSILQPGEVYRYRTKYKFGF
ncbi:galactose-1-epimerase [Vibrio sp. JC009]|uniref:galactose-1-epimerase n=1 Tax=Vibrio sp. JC009 TaxID=2912314 RepID=UPI0023B16DAE|nr:galactose-1-epimerase [Vibrio sp. JC009]WED23693.1 galactose-1-epimerase [Vibrio sp. JC009]